MSATTLSAETARKRDYQISEALHTAADLYYQGSIPEAIAGDLMPVEILVNVEGPEAVEAFATQHGIDSTTKTTASGSEHTFADLDIDPGKAVRVRVYTFVRTAK